MTALAALAPYVRPRRRPAAAGPCCQLCARAIEGDDRHPHLVDVEARTLLCACETCARAATAAAASPLRRVPRRVLVDPAAPFGAAEWAALQIPVRVAFMFFNSRLARWVVLYPGAAGAAETELSVDVVGSLRATAGLAAQAQPDVEALLVRGRDDGTFQLFLAPIDACYRLVGTVRRLWRGFSGGPAAWRELDELFGALAARAVPLGAPEAS